ncbi:uncharacterized protein F4822DRAFT_419548 [Hypoxylon trugodes]|uniref:uncharacterized protein n=1 Tax=Hypoxylon trugodes TaxID=326681 RepID=UPI002192F99C|nr:uncharacterized protein F4822DRAFT_419548 [Hypoxylon trugodes]KAI1383172.1 hypothetical protein F4822DRAFT_419548 [Hypoxylon trugodes]
MENTMNSAINIYCIASFLLFTVAVHSGLWRRVSLSTRYAGGTMLFTISVLCAYLKFKLLLPDHNN